SAQPVNSTQGFGLDAGPLKKSLFTPPYAADFNSDERGVADYLDAEETIRWWHRNVARVDYAVQGWRREKIYPDFIFAVGSGGSPARITVLETKGDHLAGNADTTYKEAVLKAVSEAFARDTTVPAGMLELVQDDGTTVRCELILLSDWRAKLPALLVDA